MLVWNICYYLNHQVIVGMETCTFFIIVMLLETFFFFGGGGEGEGKMALPMPYIINCDMILSSYV